MDKLKSTKNILREISETPKQSLLYRLYYETAKTSWLFYLNFRVKNRSNISLDRLTNIKTNDLLAYFRQRNKSKFFIDPSQKDAYRKLWLENFSSKKDSLIRSADDICSHKISSFDLKNFSWGNPINWHLAPETGKNWPKNHWSRINIANAGMGDVKYTWQLNRHQHFYALGKAYWITGEEKYAQEFISQFTDWAKNNPPGIGINWTSSLEVSIRLISWIWAYHFFLNSPNFKKDFLDLFLKNIFFSAKHIESNLNFSRYCIPNDHFIGEAFALFLIGTIFPEFKRSKKWRNTGFKILNEEIKKQTYDDGVYLMHSPYYQRFAMEFYALFFGLADLNGIKLPAETKERFEKMTIFIASLTNKNGKVPDFGENDGGKLLHLSDDEPSDFRPLVETGVMACSGKPTPAQMPSEETFWLFGNKYMEYWQKKDLASLKKKHSFPKGGYYILENENSRLIFRCGSTNSYAHADMLNFTLELDGKPIFLDNGTYLYNGDKKWRDYFKGTKAHNTAAIDDLDQMINRRKFKWLSPNPGKLIKFAKSENEDYIEGEHCGYTRLKDPVTHNRAIRLRKNEIIIADKFTGLGKHKLEFYFHLPKSGYEIDPKSRKFTAKVDGNSINIQPQNPEELQIDIKIGSENPVAGWHSSSYGHKEPCITLKYIAKAEMPYQQTFTISIT